MNAGRGKIQHKTIGDYVVWVETLSNNTIKRYSKEQCEFRHRDSIFKNNGDIVLSACFNFPAQSSVISEELKAERIQFCKKKQDNSAANFGSVFRESSEVLMNITRQLQIGTAKVHFSRKTNNWLLKEKGGTYKEALSAIEKVEKLHRFFKKDIQREVIVWD
ncbi:hypothetical protein [uncultured Bacteroides sp.]|uniref:hypothetical protein n=1 Tax=uncultured Bacteroides sp. TaxID=162156 RepID=UPI0026378BBE|nr:hypothetical protein [uncultured Bacteroides sp.]